LGQSNRFSTSYEVIKSGGPANVVTKSLLSEVGARAQRLAVGTVGWWRGSGTMGWSAVVAAVAAGVLLVVPVPSRPTPASVQASSDSASVLDRSAEVATLAGMAELLDLIAIQEDSDYLRAVGASFAELAERIANGEVTETESSRVTQE